MSEDKESPKRMAPDDTQLIQQARRGDMGAFEQLVYKYDKRVLSLAASYVNNADDAKDIYQEVFLRVYKGLKKFEARSEFSTWLHRITTNVCLTHRTKRKRHMHRSIDSEWEGDDGSSRSLAETLTDDAATDQHAVNTEISMHVQDALGTLSPQQKMVFTLRHYEGYKIREIAGMMDCAEGTVKKYLFTATRRMREQLKDVYEA